VPDSHDPRQNHLLAALPEHEYAALLPQLELVPMPLGGKLGEPGIQMRYVYFPTDCIVSLLYVMADGASAEIAIVGNEGLVGICARTHSEAARLGVHSIHLSWLPDCCQG